MRPGAKGTVTVWPALTFVGKLSTADTSASGEPAIAAVAALFAALGSAVVAAMPAVTTELPVGGCV